MRRHGAYQRPGALDPWEHNRIVARRKKYRRIARQLRASTQGSTRAFRNLADAADRAAESLRDVGRALTIVGSSVPTMVRFHGGERVEKVER